VLGKGALYSHTQKYTHKHVYMYVHTSWEQGWNGGNGGNEIKTGCPLRIVEGRPWEQGRRRGVSAARRCGVREKESAEPDGKRRRSRWYLARGWFALEKGEVALYKGTIGIQTQTSTHTHTWI